MGIANKLRELMSSKDINANELAKMVDVTPSTIYSVLQRDSKSMNLDLVMKIAHALGVSTDELLGRSGSTRYLSDIEVELIDSYRSASDDTKAAVCAVLGVKRQEEQRLSDSRLDA